MSNIQTGAERMPHDLSHLGFLAGQIGRLITISTTPVIAGDSFEMAAVGALRLSPLRRGLAIDSTVDMFTVYVSHLHVFGEQWIKFIKVGVSVFFFSSRRRHTRLQGDWSSDVCSSDLTDAGLRLSGLPLGAGRTVGDPHRSRYRLSEAGPRACRLCVRAGRPERPECGPGRSEERRVGKEGRSRWAPDH